MFGLHVTVDISKVRVPQPLIVRKPAAPRILAEYAKGVIKADISQNEFLAAFGVTEPAAPAETTPPATPPTEPETPPAGEGTPPSEPPATPPAAEPEPAPAGQDKTGQAFAQMRIENKRQKDLLNGVAAILGLDSLSDPVQIQQALEQKILAAQAQKQGITPEVLTRLQSLEADKAQNEYEKLERAAYLGFQQVKDKFGLDDKALQSFANEMVLAGQNPFEQPVDLMNAYISRHYADLIEAAIQKGIQQEAERAAKALQTSSTPVPKVGQSAGDAGKIGTVRDLTAWFDSQAK